MFTNKKYENGDSLRKCFTKCLKIANSAMKDPENLSLLVNILNKYIFFVADIEQITAGDINKLVELIKENIKQINEEGKVERARSAIKYFNNTIKALEYKMKENPEKYQNISIA